MPLLIALGSLVLWLSQPIAVQAGQTPEVTLNVVSASPRSVEALTERSVLRDYTAAWNTLADAYEQGFPGALDAYFAGSARETLGNSIAGQQKAGIHARYLNQAHNLQAVFYAPEGDVMQLQDTAEYQLQIVSDGKVIHDEHVVLRYIVLMTPGADRWVIRHIQAVPQS